MRWPYESHVTPCENCEFKDAPTFRQERRVSYREIGERGSASYSRELGTIVDVLVCLSCGHVQDEETIIS